MHDERERAPSRRRVVVATVLALYPVIVTANAFVTPHLAGLPLAVRSLPIPLFAPPLLMYVLVPEVLRLGSRAGAAYRRRRSP
jgi:antibiotic biosynthesis monooxygenase (ABM) superfamily enzyme